MCERHTTSKLVHFEDLLSMKTFGFRGEALSAISIAGHLMIVSRTKDSPCGYKMEYSNGKPLFKEPKPLAANLGTIITLENLFSNMLLRKNSLKSASEEYNLIVDLITKYAIQFSNFVSFTLCREKESTADVYTSSENQTLDNIRILYGKEVANELKAVATNSTQNIFQMTGFISSVSYSTKKLTFILFINDRLVDCAPLKRSIEAVYSNYLTKGSHPFLYMSIKMDPNILDVNVHPTKKEVLFLYDEHIISEITNCIEVKLAATTNSAPVQINSSLSILSESVLVKKPSLNKSSPRKSTNPSDKVRTDPKNQKLDEVWSRQELSTKTGVNNYKRNIELTSVIQLRKEIDNQVSNLGDIFKNSCFVGCASKESILIQHESQLVVFNYQKVTQELFYQLYLEDFGNFGYIHFGQGHHIKDLLKLYYQAHASSCQDKTIDEVCEALTHERIRSMVDDYFSLSINEEGKLTALPLLIDGHTPNIYKLPNFIYQLGHHVCWTKEKECFKQFGQALADFYSHPPSEYLEDDQKFKNMVQFIIYPKIKKVLKPSCELEEHFKVITKLNDLYKVFERC